MTQGEPYILKLKNGVSIIGYYQYTENRIIFLSTDSEGNYSFGTHKSDIQENICLEKSHTR